MWSQWILFEIFCKCGFYKIRLQYTADNINRDYIKKVFIALNKI